MKHLFTVTFLIALTVACAETGSNDQSDSTGNVSFLKDLSVEEQEEISATECTKEAEVGAEAQSETEKCVVICHVPPGHPEGKKTKVIGMSALQAHIGHGCEKNPSKDYVGPCQEDDGVDDDASGSADDSSDANF